MMTSTDEVKEAYRQSLTKERRKTRLLWGAFIGVLLGVVIAVIIAIFWPRSLPVYHLNGQCSTNYYTQQPVFTGKVVIYSYSQVKVCP